MPVPRPPERYCKRHRERHLARRPRGARGVDEPSGGDGAGAANAAVRHVRRRLLHGVARPTLAGEYGAAGRGHPFNR